MIRERLIIKIKITLSHWIIWAKAATASELSVGLASSPLFQKIRLRVRSTPSPTASPNIEIAPGWNLVPEKTIDFSRRAREKPNNDGVG